MSDEDKISTLRIRPSFWARLWTLFGGATYRVVIAHRGPVDKVLVYLNDEEIGSVTPDSRDGWLE